jgi:putative transposase
VSATYVRNLIHLVYSTKRRERRIISSCQGGLWKYQAGIYKKLESPAIIIGGVEDHVHALFSLAKTQSLMDVVEEVKKGSSKWMKSNGPQDPAFYWQRGYAAFSVSVSGEPNVRQYIQTQFERHQQLSFEDELRALCRLHGVKLDERYAWD